MGRVSTAGLAGLWIFWLGASLWLNGSAVPDWWLPIALLLGTGVAAADRGHTTSETLRADRRLSWITLASVAIAALLTGYGALATDSREWDGAASFDPKAFWLAKEPTLDQPFFSDPGVFHHSPDYPLLQPLLAGMIERLIPGGGRLVFPLLYLLLCAVTWSTFGRLSGRRMLQPVGTLAVALTPALLAPRGGGVDSGYAELILLLSTTTFASGLWQRRPLLFGLGLSLGILAKPEGIPYALIALMAAWVFRARSCFLVGGAMAVGTLGSWLPVRAALMHREAVVPFLALGGVLASLALADQLAERLRISTRTRSIVAIALPVVGLIAAPALAPMLVEPTSSFGVYAQRLGELGQQLHVIPIWLLALLDQGVGRLHLGTALLLPPALYLIARNRREEIDGPKATERSIALLVVASLLLTLLPFLLSPEDDVHHHLRSSLSRLLLHQAGPLWIWNLLWIDRLLRCAPARVAQS